MSTPNPLILWDEVYSVSRSAEGRYRILPVAMHNCGGTFLRDLWGQIMPSLSCVYLLPTDTSQQAEGGKTRQQFQAYGVSQSISFTRLSSWKALRENWAIAHIVYGYHFSCQLAALLFSSLCSLWPQITLPSACLAVMGSLF